MVFQRKISDEDWDRIRARYLRGETPADIAREFPITAQAIRKRAKKDGWVDFPTDPRLRIMPPERVKQVDEADRLYEEIRKQREEAAKDAPEEPAAEPEPSFIGPNLPFFRTSRSIILDPERDTPAKLLMRHRFEWDDHKDILEAAMAERDVHLAKLAKITAETLAIRQRMERLAWNIPDPNVSAKLPPGDPTDGCIDITPDPNLDDLSAEELEQLSVIAEKIDRSVA